MEEATNVSEPTVSQITLPDTTSAQVTPVGAFLAAGDLLVEVLHRKAVAARWDEPSALADMTIGTLVGHTARAVLTVTAYLDEIDRSPVTSGEAERQVDAAGYVLAVLTTDDQDSALHVGIRQRSAELSELGPVALYRQVEEALADVRNRVPPVAGTLVRVAGGQIIRLHDYLVTRLVELVVHLDDVSVSIGEPIETPASADRFAIATLAEIARRRHGTAAMVAQLARRERIQAAVTAL